MESPRHYLAIVRPDNLRRLVESGFNFYALSSRAMPVKTADYIVLYKSRDGEPRRKSTPGIVGLFKVTGEPHEVNRGPLSLMFPMQVPWQAIMACTDHPLPIAPLVPSLKMFPNKKNYGSALQGSMKKLTPGDYDIIASAFNQHLAALDTAHNLTT